MRTPNGTAGDNSCGRGHGGAGIGCVAVSGVGNASNSAGNSSCGDASAYHDEIVPVLPGAAGGCVAVRGAGSASNTAGDNSCAYTVGEVAAVGCVEIDGGAPQGVPSVPPPLAVGGAHGCVASAGAHCSFTGLSGGAAPAGYISASDASWTITHVSGSTTVTDASGTGPGIGAMGFSDGVTYTLTVGAGNGVVVAGSPQ